MSLLTNKEIVLGITGSIAAYKSCDLVRKLHKEGGMVTCVLTESATKFVSTLTLQNLSKRKVYQEMFDTEEWDIEHISLSQKKDILVIAPATANIIGKLAAGIADDLLTSVVLAARTPVLIAPAMNSAMYQNSVVQDNINKLKKRGIYFIGPACGELACGEKNVGRLVDNNQIVAEIYRILKTTGKNSTQHSLSGKTVLVTAGPTREYIDAVRYISNSSSGKMGYALAKKFRDTGAEVILVSGHTSISAPIGIKTILVDSAKEMLTQVNRYYRQSDIIVSTAAVSDYRPQTKVNGKIKSVHDKLELQLVKNPDIIAQIGRKKGNRLLIGFALETENLIDNAKLKLKTKNLDLIIANHATTIAQDTIQAKMIFQSDSNNKLNVIELPDMDKEELSAKIVAITIDLLKKGE